MPAWKQEVRAHVRAREDQSRCPAGETRCRGGSLPVLQTPQSLICSPFISPCAGQTWVIAVWIVQDSAGNPITGRLSSKLRPPALVPAHSCHKQLRQRCLKPPTAVIKQQSFWGWRLLSTAVNYSPVIDSTHCCNAVNGTSDHWWVCFSKYVHWKKTMKTSVQQTKAGTLKIPA